MRWLRRVHAWAGLALALVVATVALTGTLLVFKADYLRAIFPTARQVAVTDAGHLGELVAMVEREFGGNLRSVVFGTDEMVLHRVYLRDGGGAYLDSIGAVVDRWDGRARPEAWLFDLHDNLLIGSAGHLVTGAVGLAAALFAVTGLVLWAPGARGFRGRVWPRSSRRPALLAQHRDLGAIAAIPVLLLALTGAAMVFDDQARAVLAALLVEDGQESSSRQSSHEAKAPSRGDTARSRMTWRDQLIAAQASFPDGTIRIVSIDHDRREATVRLRQPAEWHPNGRTQVKLSMEDGQLLERKDATRQSRTERTYAALYPLHAARVGGRWYDALVGVTGVALAGLALVGSYSYVRLLARQTGAAPATAERRQG